MKRNLYYKAVFARTNYIKMAILGFFLAIASWPRLLLEVFIRKDFGERYFSLATAIILFLILSYFPMFHGFSYSYGYGGDGGFWSYVKSDPTWYLFLFGFLAVSIMRYLEIRNSPSVFDFAKFSLSTGIINPIFYRIKISGKRPDSRTISIFLEPAFFFIIGLILFLLKQSVGVLIMVCAVCYSLGYYGSYYVGDEFIMDTIDEMICNEELVSSFVEGKDSWQTRGFDGNRGRTVDPEMRRKMADYFTQDVDYEEVK